MRFVTPLMAHRPYCTKSTTNLDNRKPAEPLDILIVGAGPAGLTAALGALHRGINNIAVYDQTSAFSKIGRNIDLMPNGINAFKSVNPKIYDAISERFRPPRGGYYANYVSSSGHERVSGNIWTHGYIASFQWWELQEYLLRLIPSELIHINHHLVDIQNDEERGVAIVKFVKNRERRNRFKNWMENNTERFLPEHAVHEEVSITAKLVIGADGINSTARRIIYKHSHSDLEEYALPCYTGLTNIRMSGSLTLPTQLEAKLDKTFLKTRLSFVTVDSERMKHDSIRLMIVKTTQQQSSFSHFISCYAPIDEQQALSCSKKDLVLEAQKIAKEHGHPSELIQLINELFKAFDEDGVIIRPQYIVPVSNPLNFEKLPLGKNSSLPNGVNRPWFCGRSVLVGDSLHGCPPFLSQGTSMAIEDALVLMDVLVKSSVFDTSVEKKKQYEALQSVFRQYRNVREPRLQRLQKYTLNGPTIWEDEYEAMNNEINSYIYQT